MWRFIRALGGGVTAGVLFREGLAPQSMHAALAIAGAAFLVFVIANSQICGGDR